MKTLGFIGLGSQGAPMARRQIDAGYPMVLWARRPESLAPFADTAATMADSLEDLAVRVDHVGICVVDDAGERLFTDKDAAELGKKSAAALDRVFAVAQRLNGLSPSDVEELTKN